MPANYTRRLDLFADAGFTEPERLIAGLTTEAERLGLSADWRGSGERLRAALGPRVAGVPADQRRLAALVPEWLTGRSGDLATALWMARTIFGPVLDLDGFVLSILDALAAQGPGPCREAPAFARFMFDLGFDWNLVYAERGQAYQFLHEREPNPLVWRLLEDLRQRQVRLSILELGCGIGNDALGFLRSGLVDRYVGIDVSAEAIEAFSARLHRDRRDRTGVQPVLLRADFLGVLGYPPPEVQGINLVYSYSSLHYFSSGELAQIYALVHRLLPPRRGFFGFGIKGAGSVWDGQGLPLYRPDVWINWDGQSRWFPSREALVRQIDRAGFEVRFHELHEHWGYSEFARKDVFHYMLCSPRAGE